MTIGDVTVEFRDHVGVLTLDRQARRNAIDDGMLSALDGALDKVSASRCRAVVITGAGEAAFCAGQDIHPENPQVAALVSAVQTGDRGPAEALIRRVRAVVDRLVGLPVPVIAAINGVAYGGGAELATRCDLRVMAPKAVICFSEVKLGLMPDWGGGVALARLLGPSRAADLVLTARPVGATEALSLGLVNRVSAEGTALAEAVALGDAIAANGPRAVRSALEVLRRSNGLSVGEALEVEFERAAALIAKGECVHGISAFLSRTPPAFPDVAD
jgi:enoyl-CoA hydratase